MLKRDTAPAPLAMIRGITPSTIAAVVISKHAILIVEFANELQRSGVAKREAVERAAGVRLRPILMTTAAMVLGVIPLIIASGAGAVSRFNMGLVIASGLSVGTLFTLFVVPAVYLLVATDHSRRTEGELAPAPQRVSNWLQSGNLPPVLRW